MQHCGLKENRMSNLDKLLNNYCVLQVLKNYAKLSDKDEIIFSNFEELIFFIDEIRADEREACAVGCLEGTDMPVQVDVLKIIRAERERISNTIRARGNHEALDRMVAENQRLGLYDDAVNMSEECVHKSDKSMHEYVLDCPRCGHCCQQKEWVGLTDEEIMDRWPCETRIEFARWVEAKLKEKNG